MWGGGNAICLRDCKRNFMWPSSCKSCILFRNEAIEAFFLEQNWLIYPFFPSENLIFLVMVYVAEKKEWNWENLNLFYNALTRHVQSGHVFFIMHWLVMSSLDFQVLINPTRFMQQMKPNKVMVLKGTVVNWACNIFKTNQIIYFFLENIITK